MWRCKITKIPKLFYSFKFLTLKLGHEAFSNLVDVAVQQPSLPVPNEATRGRPHITVSAADPPSQQSQHGAGNLAPPHDARNFHNFSQRDHQIALQHVSCY